MAARPRATQRFHRAPTATSRNGRRLLHGGFSLSPKSLVGDFFGHVDTVLRVDHLVLPGRAPMRVMYTGGEQWPPELGTFGQPQDWRMWRTKNREGVGQAVVPADLGAFLRARQPPYAGL